MFLRAFQNALECILDNKLMELSVPKQQFKQERGHYKKVPQSLGCTSHASCRSGKKVGKNALLSAKMLSQHSSTDLSV